MDLISGHLEGNLVKDNIYSGRILVLTNGIRMLLYR